MLACMCRVHESAGTGLEAGPRRASRGVDLHAPEPNRMIRAPVKNCGSSWRLGSISGRKCSAPAMGIGTICSGARRKMFQLRISISRHRGDGSRMVTARRGRRHRNKCRAPTCADRAHANTIAPGSRIWWRRIRCIQVPRQGRSGSNGGQHGDRHLFERRPPVRQKDSRRNRTGDNCNRSIWRRRTSYARPATSGLANGHCRPAGLPRTRRPRRPPAATCSTGRP